MAELHSISTINSELLNAIAEGDEKAFRKLFDHYWDRLFGVAIAFTKSYPLSEELIQDVFMKIWQNRRSLGEIKNFDGYIFMVARNHIYNELRRKLRELPFEEALRNHFAETSLADDILIMKDAGDLIRQGVATLPPQQKAVFEMSRFEGLSHEEIAERLNISRLTVKVHMSKALQRVKEYVTKMSGGITGGFALFLLLR